MLADQDVKGTAVRLVSNRYLSPFFSLKEEERKEGAAVEFIACMDFRICLQPAWINERMT
jgi:hypothetical protein